MKKNGFTLIELLVCFALVTIVSISLFKTVLTMQEKQKKNILYNEFIALTSNLNEQIGKDFNSDVITNISDCGNSCYTITYKNKGNVLLDINKDTGVISYGSFKEKLPNTYKLYKDLEINIYNTGEDDDNYNAMLILTIPIKSSLYSKNDDIKYAYQYNREKNILLEGTIYTLTINPNGGTYDGKSAETIYELTTGGSVNIGEPTRSGYLFERWDVSGTPQSISSNSVTIGSENVVLTAEWEEPIKYTCTLQLTCNQGYTLSGSTCQKTRIENLERTFGATTACEVYCKNYDGSYGICEWDSGASHCYYQDYVTSSYNLTCENGTLIGSTCTLTDQDSCPNGWTSS